MNKKEYGLLLLTWNIVLNLLPLFVLMINLLLVCFLMKGVKKIFHLIYLAIK